MVAVAAVRQVRRAEERLAAARERGQVDLEHRAHAARGVREGDGVRVGALANALGLVRALEIQEEAEQHVDRMVLREDAADLLAAALERE